jgi:aminopeptidase
MQILRKRDLDFMKEMQCYIAVRGGANRSESADVPKEKGKLCQTHYGTDVLQYRVNHTRWTSMQWPTPALAQMGSMSTEQFEDYYFDVCTLDYTRMDAAAVPLVERMKRTDKVRIVGPADTDIEFSIKGIPVVACTGTFNLPDGEIFTAPVRESVNGVIHYNVGTFCHGKPCDDVRLVFKDGKVIEATGSDTKGINEVLDTDENARYVGEFAIGINPLITKPMRNTLFDEKISGSIHLTPGMAYEVANNGNNSKIHWDMVMIQTEEYGGGEMYFDDELIRKDGLFVPDYLQCLNPENLA